MNVLQRHPPSVVAHVQTYRETTFIAVAAVTPAKKAKNAAPVNVPAQKVKSNATTNVSIPTQTTSTVVPVVTPVHLAKSVLRAVVSQTVPKAHRMPAMAVVSTHSAVDNIAEPAAKPVVVTNSVKVERVHVPQQERPVTTSVSIQTIIQVIVVNVEMPVKVDNSVQKASASPPALSRHLRAVMADVSI